MHITLIPQRRDDTLTVSKQGDILTINTIPYDFSVIPGGAILPSSAVSCPFLTGDIERIAGELHLSLLLPHGANPTQERAFPAILINVPDGTVEFPA